LDGSEPRLRGLNVFLASSANAFADFRVVYTWRGWLIGWLGRVLTQVLFYGSLGLLVGPGTAAYVTLGSAVSLTALETLQAIQSTTWERGEGTLPLLFSAPTSLWPIFVGRSVEWLLSGLLTSSVALFLVSPLFNVRWTASSVVVAASGLLLCTVSMYLFALSFGALVLLRPQVRNLVANVLYLCLVIICGVTVPIDMWPRWVGVVGDAIPMTHAIEAVRLATGVGIHGGGGVRIGSAVREIVHVGLAGVAWALVARSSFGLLRRLGPKSGAASMVE
jgi:ABC-2 type transport system permease protein